VSNRQYDLAAWRAARDRLDTNRNGLRMVDAVQTLDLIQELWDASEPAARCPHLRHDADGCRCVAVADLVTSRMVCDHLSLQLWCLAGPERWPVCASFPA